MNLQTLKALMWSNAYWTINKELARSIGIEETLLLQDLIDKSFYFSEKWQTVEIDWLGYFYNTCENIENDTTLTEKKQIRCLKTLQDLWLIVIKVAWLPAKRHFHINIDKIIKLFQKGETSSAKKEKLVPPKRRTNNNKYNNNKYNNISLSKDKESKAHVWSIENNLSFYTEKEKETSHPPTPLSYWREDINNLISDIKQLCNQYNIPYKPINERQYAKHILSKKFKSDTNNYYNLSLYDFLETLFKWFSTLKYCKTINWPYTIYYNWADVLLQIQKEIKSINTGFAIW